MVRLLLFATISTIIISCTKTVVPIDNETIQIVSDTIFIIGETSGIGDGDNSFATETELGLIKIEGEQNGVAEIPEPLVPSAMEWIHMCPVLK